MADRVPGSTIHPATVRSASGGRCRSRRREYRISGVSRRPRKSIRRKNTIGNSIKYKINIIYNTDNIFYSNNILMYNKQNSYIYICINVFTRCNNRYKLQGRIRIQVTRVRSLENRATTACIPIILVSIRSTSSVRSSRKLCVSQRVAGGYATALFGFMRSGGRGKPNGKLPPRGRL